MTWQAAGETQCYVESLLPVSRIFVCTEVINFTSFLWIDKILRYI